MSSSCSPHPMAERLPRAAAQMQEQIETLYLSKLRLEQDVQAMRATYPILLSPPPRPVLARRLLLRLSGWHRRRYELSLIRGCGLFNAGWYLKTYPDVAAAGMDPARHFRDHGHRERRSPGPYFDTEHYLQLYPDIAANGMNPLVHYLIAGWAEKRSIQPDMPHGGVT